MLYNVHAFHFYAHAQATTHHVAHGTCRMCTRWVQQRPLRPIGFTWTVAVTAAAAAAAWWAVAEVEWQHPHSSICITTNNLTAAGQQQQQQQWGSSNSEAVVAAAMGRQQLAAVGQFAARQGPKYVLGKVCDEIFTR